MQKPITPGIFLGFRLKKGSVVLEFQKVELEVSRPGAIAMAYVLSDLVE